MQQTIEIPQHMDLSASFMMQRVYTTYVPTHPTNREGRNPLIFARVDTHDREPIQFVYSANNDDPVDLDEYDPAILKLARSDIVEALQHTAQAARKAVPDQGTSNVFINEQATAEALEEDGGTIVRWDAIAN